MSFTLTRYAVHDLIHEPLKRCCCIRQPHGHDAPLEMAKFTRECCLLPIFSSQWNLIISGEQIEFGAKFVLGKES